ncbi:MAG: hypothetical protein ABEJ88_05590 [Halobacterium sp.]
MERFVQLVAAGSVVLVGALWAAELAATGSAAWLVAVAAAAVGCLALAAGIATELDV